MPIVTITFFPRNICPGDICPYKQYFSCYLPNSDQTLRVVPGTLYFNCNGHICPGNIGPGKICPYHEYFRCYWPNFDKTFWVQFLEAVISFDQNIFGPNFVWPKLFWTYTFFWTQNLNPNFCWPIIVWIQTVLDQHFLGLNFFLTQIVLDLRFLDQNFVWTKCFSYRPEKILLNFNINATTTFLYPNLSAPKILPEFVLIRNLSAIILNEPNFFSPKFFKLQISLEPKHFWRRIVFDQKFF